MDISADAVFLLAHNERDLAVCFQPDQSVNDMAACFLELLRPDNIVFLVKTGFQLNENRHLLAILGGLCQ